MWCPQPFVMWTKKYTPDEIRIRDLLLRETRYPLRHKGIRLRFATNLIIRNESAPCVSFFCTVLKILHQHLCNDSIVIGVS